MTRVLIVVSAADHLTLADGTEHPTGFWAEELVVPHQIFTEAGWEVVVATPGGVQPTVDEASLQPAMAGGPERAAEIAAGLEALATTLDHPAVLAEVDPDAFDVVFYPGGHGPMQDLATDKDSARILTATLAADRPLGVLCHAPAALLATQDADGSSPFAGYRMTAFTDAEEQMGGLADRLEWLVEARLTAMGATVVAGAPFAPHIEVDRSLWTGQNPASSHQLATALVGAATSGVAPV